MRKKQCENNPRLNRIGGEAVLEGVMMKAGHACPTAVRMPGGAIRVLPREFHSVKEKHKWLNLPVLRGVVGFIETMRLSLSVMTASAEVMMEEETKDENGKKQSTSVLMSAVTAISTILGIALALALFIYLPNLASAGLEKLFHRDLGIWKAITSGVIKILIFILYIYLISLMPDIRRTFQYHGAEHKTIACFESGEELTPANAKKCSRFHPRCGTSFMFVMILLGIILSLAVRAVLERGFLIDFEAMTGSKMAETLIYTGIGLLLLPLIMGVGYEFLMYAGKHCSSPVVRFFSAPGLWMQRLTTREPSEEQLEVAIAATKYALTDIYPDFDRAAYAAEGGYLPTEKAPDAESSAETGSVPDTAGNTPATDAPAPSAPGASSEETGE